ncbi:MAG: MFS transporter [Cyclobacteriaceae bacterium]|nr:MFS transporter [Cyclobacteriaceae bacterium]
MRKPIFVIFITIFIDMLGFGIIIPILPIFSKELGAENYQVGLIAMSFPVMNFLFAPFWGSLSDRYGRRPIILWSVFITTLAYLLFSQSINLWILLLSRILSGIGSANLSVAQAYVSDVSRPEERAKSMGIIGAAFGLGFIIGPTVGGYLKSLSTVGHVEWVGYGAAMFCILNLVLAYFFLPESLKERKPETTFNFKVISGISAELRKPVIRELLLINFIFITGFMIMQIAVTLFWREFIGLTEIQMGYMFAFIGVTTVIVQGGLVGKLVRRYGEHRLVLAGVYLCIVAFAMIPWVTRNTFIPLELIAFALLALANGCITPSITSLLSKSANPSDVGQVLGVNQSFGSLARAAGMAMGGAIYGFEFHLPFMTAATIMIICIWLSRTVSHAKPVVLSNKE